jgi:hypothetical protein
MRFSSPLLSVASAVALLNAPVRAQQPPDPTASMKRQLRNLVTAQEAYFASHVTYTTDVAALGRFLIEDSLRVQVLHAGGRSWSGRAVHQGRPGKSCVIYVGYLSDFPSPPVTDADSIRATREAEPVCDRT